MLYRVLLISLSASAPAEGQHGTVTETLVRGLLTVTERMLEIRHEAR